MIKWVLLMLPMLIFASCSEKLTFESDDEIITTEELEPQLSLDVSKKDAIITAGLFFQNETKNGGSRVVGEVEEIRDSLQIPLAYIINYVDNGGFVIVSATKEFYPILAFSEIGNYRLDSGMFSDVWLGVMKSEIVYRKSDNDTTYFSQWNKYSSPVTSPSKHRATKVVESYQNISWWRSEFIADLHSIDNFPSGYFDGRGEFVGDMYCTLNEVRQELDDYSGDFDRVQSYLENLGYDPDVAIFHIKTFTEQSKKDIMLSTYWHQGKEFSKYCYKERAPGCVPVAIGQIMNYHKWPTHYAQWNSFNSDNDNAAQLLAKIGSEIGMVYLENKTFPRFWEPFNFGDFSQVKKFFTDNQYSVSKDAPQGNLGEIGRIILEGFPVYMEGTKESFSFWGVSIPSFKAHAWVCDGFIMHKYSNVLVDIYLPRGYNQGDYVPLENNPYKRDYDFSISKEREYGWSYYHMNWGWGNSNVNDVSISINNGWFLNADISKLEDVNFSMLYRYIKITPNR